MDADLESFSDEQLARQSQAGSLLAFEQLVYRYEKRIYGFVFQSCRNERDAREITQDTFVKAFQAIDQFHERHAFAAWLFTIARRKCIDHYRTSRTCESAEQMPDQVDFADPAELLAQREDNENLWEVARRRLARNQFQALWLRYVEDMNIAQNALVMRRTQTHVKVLLFRARQALSGELSPQSYQKESPIMHAAFISPL